MSCKASIINYKKAVSKMQILGLLTVTVVKLNIVLMELPNLTAAMHLGHPIFITVNPLRLSLLKIFHSIALFSNSKKNIFLE